MFRTETDEGPIILTFPETLRPRDIDFFEEQVAIVIRTMRRIVDRHTRYRFTKTDGMEILNYPNDSNAIMAAQFDEGCIRVERDGEILWSRADRPPSASVHTP
jgi:hypothetical protein